MAYEFNPALCEGCPAEGKYEPIHAKYNPDARFLVVVDVPTPALAQKDRLLSVSQMNTLGEQLTTNGFEKSDFRFTPACHCAFEPDDHTNKEKSAILKHCRQHFLAEVEQGQSEVIIPLGAAAATQAFGKNTKITKVRGMASESEGLGRPLFPLMSPGIVVKYPQNAPVFNADVQSFARYVNAGYSVADAANATSGEYEIITDLQFLIDMAPEVLSFDTENTGLRWYTQGRNVREYDPRYHKDSPIFSPKFQILTMQFSVEPGKGYMLVWDHPEAPIPEEDKPRLRNQLRQLLCNEDTLVIGQNAKYDNVAMWMTEGIRYRIGGDTLMLATLVDENMPEKNLDVLTKIFAPEMAGYADVFNAKYDKSRMWQIPLQELVGYGCGDTDAALRVYLKLEEMVAEDKGQWAHYSKVTIPGLNALASMETQGMHIDEGHALAEFKAHMIASVDEQRRALLREIPREVRQDVLREYTAKNKGADAATKALSLTRSDFLKQVLFTHPKGFRLRPKVYTKTTANLRDKSLREPSVSAKDHLPYFFEECPFTLRLAEYIKDESLLSKSVVSFEKKYIVSGKVRPTYHLHKAVTGRSSSEDPNGQNYPKRGARAKVYRKMFVPPPGYYVCEMDLSQAELRIAASMSGDKAMIEIYRNNGDIHTATALIVMGVTAEQFAQLSKTEQKDARTKAKSVNFGFLYGMGWRKFIGFAKTQYGVEFTEDEAQRVRTGFFHKYKGLAPWHRRVREFAQEYKRVRSYSGRLRHLPMVDSNEEYVRAEAERQAINSPVQEFGSSLGIMALGRMNEEIDSEYLKVVGFIHDAIVVYVKKEYLDWGMKTVKRYMETNPLTEWFNTTLKVPIVADCGFGLNLGEIHECAGFSLDEPYDYSRIADDKGNPLIDVPRQRIPPNRGRLTRSPYTLPSDLEDETCHAPTRRRARMIRAAASASVAARVERSEKQMVRNRRLRAVREDEQRARRMQRTRPAKG